MSVGLVLEGGGTRGAYTAGVLDGFVEAGLEFPSVYGISAGACNALSYLSRQPGRNLQIFSRYVPTDAYVSRKNLLLTGSLFGFDYIFGKLFHEQLPFDYETFFQTPVRFLVGATDVLTGKAVFFGNADIGEDMQVIRASSSLPFVSKVVRINGRGYLDGGIAQPIPIYRAVCDHAYNVIVLTRDRSDSGRSKPDFPKAMMKLRYGKYPNLVRAMLHRPQEYREELAYCARLEEQGKAFVIRPSVPVAVGRTEKDAEKLTAVYELGLNDCREQIGKIQEFLQAHS